MNRIELLDNLYASRRELLRLIIASAQQQLDEHKLHELVQKRDAITWTINALLDAELLASVGHIDEACKQISASTAELKRLVDIASDVDKAIGLATEVLNAATGVVGALGGKP